MDNNNEPKVKDFFHRNEDIHTSTGGIDYPVKTSAFLTFLRTYMVVGKGKNISRELVRVIYKNVIPKKYHISNVSDLGRVVKAFIIENLPDGSRDKINLQNSARNPVEKHHGEDCYVWIALIQKHPEDNLSKPILEQICGHDNLGIKRGGTDIEVLESWRRELALCRNKFSARLPTLVDFTANGYYVVKVDVPGTATNDPEADESYCVVKGDTIDAQPVLKIKWCRVVVDDDPITYQDYMNGIFERFIQVRANVTGEPTCMFQNGVCRIRWKLALQRAGSFTVQMEEPEHLPQPGPPGV